MIYIICIDIYNPFIFPLRSFSLPEFNPAGFFYNPKLKIMEEKNSVLLFGEKTNGDVVVTLKEDVDSYSEKTITLNEQQQRQLKNYLELKLQKL